MSEEANDPGGTTEAFRTFAQRNEPAASRSPVPFIVAAAVAVMVLAAVLIIAFG